MVGADLEKESDRYVSGVSFSDDMEIARLLYLHKKKYAVVGLQATLLWNSRKKIVTFIERYGIIVVDNF